MISFCCLLYAGVALAQQPPKPTDGSSIGTDFLDHDSPISSYFGKEFLKENIPYIDIPDKNIEEVYYYRWSTLADHLRYTTAGSGYILTEFIQPVGYAEEYNTIDAAAGHQIDEARWLRSGFYAGDYIQIYTRGPGNTTQYTNWITDAAYRRAHVNGDLEFLTSQLDGFVRMWNEWDFVFDSDVGLYYYTPVYDAQEYSLPGYVEAAVTDNSSAQFAGPNTYRPSHNAYMAANARAVAETAQIAGYSELATNFTLLADTVERAMYEHLWSEDQHFFVDVIRPDNPNLTQLKGREEVGLFPFRFGIGLEEEYCASSSKELFDPDGFYTTYGPTTLEVRSQYYDATKPTSYCCYWNGQSWPFSTAHVLKSLAAMHRSDSCSIVAEQYYQYLSIYATTQHKDGKPYVAESHYPDLDSWSADSFNHSEHYDHSTNNDDVITGLLGLVPRLDGILQISPIIPSNWTYFALENVPYHGHLLTILYDLEGTRYNEGPGLHIFVNGRNIHTGPDLQAEVQLPESNVEGGNGINDTVPVNIAANVLGLGAYPLADATFTFTLDDPYKSIDGYLFYYSEPDNRWTNFGSPNTNDTLQITFPRPRNISSVTLGIYSDVARNGTVDCPQTIEIYGSDQNNGSVLLAKLDPFDTCMPNELNTIFFDQTVESSFIAVNMHNKADLFVGVCELQVWVPPDRTTGVYYAVDAVLTSAEVVFNPAEANATTNGAVVGSLQDGNSVLFSGIYDHSREIGPREAQLSYANSGDSTAAAEIVVNSSPGTANNTLSLPPTGGSFTTVSLPLDLLPGSNFVNAMVQSGYDGVELEFLYVI